MRNVNLVIRALALYAGLALLLAGLTVDSELLRTKRSVKIPYLGRSLLLERWL